MKYILIMIFAFSISTVQAQEIDCDNVQSQAAINECTARALELADQELNSTWKRVQKTFGNDEYEKRRKAKLLASQRAWIAYRDAECDGSVGQEWEGGSGRPMAVYLCSAALTKERTARLNERFSSR